MAITKHETVKDDRHLDCEEEFDDDRDFDPEECDSDESQEEDPSYVVVEESNSAFLKRSLKRSKSRVLKDDEEVESLEVKVPELDEEDKKSFEKIEEIIQAGQLERLKVDQCKVYLKKFGLRLTGKKDVLMERIKEHLEVRDGGGEKKYPISSFVLNCKGDACTGDVVMFEQNVYEMYNVASRSATGPPCGTRTVAGRIVKESYGAAKQQHTFTLEAGNGPNICLHACTSLAHHATSEPFYDEIGHIGYIDHLTLKSCIEKCMNQMDSQNKIRFPSSRVKEECSACDDMAQVSRGSPSGKCSPAAENPRSINQIEVLWSKGEKSLLPLHPLLIKGRNLYRLKTMRQRWANEEERRKVLLEKHTRGFNARCSREARIQEKEMRKMLGNMRIKKKECIGSQEQSNRQKQNTTTQNENQHPNIQDQGNLQQQKPIKCSEIRQSNNQKLGNHQQQNPIKCSEIRQPSITNRQQHYPIQQSLSAHQNSSSTQKWGNAILSPPRQQNHCMFPLTDQQHYQANGHMSPGFRYRQLMANANPSVWPLSIGFSQRQLPLTSCNSFRWDQATLNSTVQSPPYNKSWVPAGTQLCHYYLQGKCWYGNTCKYLHEK